MNNVGELFVWGFNGPTVPAWLKQLDREFGVGGVILFDYDVQKKSYSNNILSPKQLEGLCRDLSDLSSRPMLMVDQEGGKVRRLKDGLGFAPLPSAQAFSSLPEREKRQVLQRSFGELRDLGFHFNLAPVIDLNTNQTNPDIGLIGRSFSSKVEEVRTNALIVNEIATEVGLGLCLKHFPGLGGATTNSHLELTDLSNALSDEQIDLFYDLLPKMSGKALLLSHGLVKQWEEKLPVSLSKKAVSTIRKKCPDALLLSDDLQMKGLQAILGTQPAVVEGARAGLDLFVIGNNLMNEEGEKAFAIVSTLKKAFAEDPELARNVDRSLERIRERKKSFANPFPVTYR